MLCPVRRRIFFGLVFVCLFGIISVDLLFPPPARILPFSLSWGNAGSGTNDTIIDDLYAVDVPSHEDDRPLPRILLVTALYPLQKSKHSKEEYAEWLKMFLGQVTTDIYFFVPPELEEVVREARPEHLHMTLNTTFASPFDIPPLRGKEEQYIALHEIDRERKKHAPDLYAVWNAKPYFLDEGLTNAGRDVYDYAFWNDAGSFRGAHNYTLWPDPQRVRDVWQAHEDRILFPIYTFPSWWSAGSWTENKGPLDAEFSEGSFFGGPPDVVSWWQRVFYAYHDYYLAAGMFVGKDQTLINSLFLLFPQRIMVVWLHDDGVPHAGHRLMPLYRCGADWFYYQFWLASDAARAAMIETWDSPPKPSDKTEDVSLSTWLESEWFYVKDELLTLNPWRDSVSCPSRGRWEMEDLLIHRFGEGWAFPNPTVTTS